MFPHLTTKGGGYLPVEVMFQLLLIGVGEEIILHSSTEID